MATVECRGRFGIEVGRPPGHNGVDDDLERDEIWSVKEMCLSKIKPSLRLRARSRWVITGVFTVIM